MHQGTRKVDKQTEKDSQNPYQALKIYQLTKAESKIHLLKVGEQHLKRCKLIYVFKNMGTWMAQTTDKYEQQVIELLHMNMIEIF